MTHLFSWVGPMGDECGAAVPTAVRRPSLPAAPTARPPRDSRQDAGATIHQPAV